MFFLANYTLIVCYFLSTGAACFSSEFTSQANCITAENKAQSWSSGWKTWCQVK